MKIPRWAQVLIGIAIVAVFLGIGAIIAITAWVSQNIHSTSATSSDADLEMDKVRQQFKARPPLLEMVDGRPIYDEARLGAPPAQAPPLQHLYVLAWDPDDDRLSRVTIPWWMIRMKSGSFSFGAYTSGFDDRVKMRVEDIEKYGPGLVLDFAERRGERVLVWVQ